MTPLTARWILWPLLFAASFLPRGLKGSLAGLGHGRCTEERCVGLFAEFADFDGALAACKKSEGQLLEWDAAAVAQIAASLPPMFAGSYWLRAPREVAPTGTGCASVSLGAPRDSAAASPTECQRILDGFLCQYPNEEPCPGLVAVGGARVTYVSHRGFQVHGSEAFPQGTTASTEKAGAQHPETKHLCFERAWLRAPWNCEVLGGGCELGCDKEARACTCPPGRPLAANNVSCAADPCEGESGLRLCTRHGEECASTQGGFECVCKDGFARKNGVCLDASVCVTCEHVCELSGAGFKCACRNGYRVSASDSSRCEMHCDTSECQATCVSDRDQAEPQCSCPAGYILHQPGNGEPPVCSDINECDDHLCHWCENLPGSFVCTCKRGYELRKGVQCVAAKEDQGEEPAGAPEKEGEDRGEDQGSASGEPSSPYPSLHPAAAGAQPEGAVPSYVKTGSVLGIAVFAVLAVALLSFLVHGLLRRCGSFRLDSFKHSNMDNMLYLQQVTTETYKRLSPDKPFKSEPQVP